MEVSGMSGSALVPGAGAFLTVQSLGRNFALPIGCTRSIFRVEGLTRVPLAPPFLLGLVNLRGRVVAVACLNRRLRPRAPPLGVGSLAVAIELGPDVLALAVEDVGGVVEARRQDFVVAKRRSDGGRGAVGLGLLRPAGTTQRPTTVLDVRALFEFGRPFAV
jgi:purine-binding chemotaxis protein CheW